MKYICVCLMLVLFSCTDNKSKSIYKCDKKMIVNKGSILYRDVSINKECLKLLIPFSGDCAMCIFKISNWKMRIDQTFEGYELETIFVALNSDVDILTFNLDEINFKGNVRIFKGDNFINNNKNVRISEDSFYLLTPQDSIIMECMEISPLNFEKIKKYYN